MGPLKTEGQVRAYMGSIYQDFKGHGKELTPAEMLKLINYRLENKGPHIEAYFLDYSERDLVVAKQILEYDQAVAKEHEKKVKAQESAKVKEEKKVEDKKDKGKESNKPSGKVPTGNKKIDIEKPKPVSLDDTDLEDDELENDDEEDDVDPLDLE